MKKQSGSQKEQTSSSGKLGNLVRDIRTFLEQSQAEIKKVVWPTRKEILATSWAVLFLVAVMSLYLGLVDFGLVKIIEGILS